MTNEQKVKEFRRIVNEMADLYEKKNKNYGNSFGKLYEDLGPIAGIVPLHNKIDRITNLVKGGKNDFESLEDTFKDLACYAIMNLIEAKAKESEKTTDNTISTITQDKPITHTNLDEYKDYFELGNKWYTYSNKPCYKCTRMDTAYSSVISPCSGCKYYQDTYTYTLSNNTASTSTINTIKDEEKKNE